MKRFYAKAALFAIRAKRRANDIIRDNKGGGDDHTNNAGYAIIGLIIIGLILTVMSPWVQDTLLPKIKSLISNLW
jgi:hypothetical protein